ncbi:MAG TPA: hypothetical protein VIL92_01850 [Gaiellaceae bacterium]
MIRLAPVFVLVLVTALLFGYGSYAWSWLAGPIAALAVWSLDRNAHRPGAPAPAHLRHRTPAPVD